MSSTLVTCFCPTRNRRAWLPAAIRCFQSQTYSNKELVIVADGEDVRDLIPSDDSRITLVRLMESERPLMLPDKFQFCCAMGKGSILSKWDDDDWYSPDRIEHQVELLESSGKAVTGYHSILFTDGASWYRYANPSWVSGTSLCFRREWALEHPFEAARVQPPSQVGSDGVFASFAQRQGQMCSAAAHDRVVAAIHAGNTSQKMVTGCHWMRLEGFPGVAGYEWPLGVAA